MNLFYFFISIQTIYTTQYISIEFNDCKKDIYNSRNIIEQSNFFNSDSKKFDLKEFSIRNFQIVENLLCSVPDKHEINFKDLLEILKLKDALQIFNPDLLDTFYMNLYLICIHSDLDLAECADIKDTESFMNWAPGIQDLKLKFSREIFYLLKIGEVDVIPVFEHKIIDQVLLLTKDVCRLILDLDENSMEILIRLVDFYGIKELVILDYVMVEKFVIKIAKLTSITHLAYEVREDIKLPANMNLLEHIEGIALYVNYTNIKSFEQINKMTHLKSLTIRSDLATHAYIGNLKNLTNLTHLELSNIWLTSIDFNTISTFTKLRTLDIIGFSHYNISDALKNLLDLEVLKLYIKENDPCLNQNRTLVVPNNLSALKVLSIYTEDISPGFAKNLPVSLRELNIINCKIEDADLQEIFKKIGLQVLNVRNKNEGDEAWNNISHLQNLNSLNVSGVALKPRNMIAFTNLLNLKDLDISNLEGYDCRVFDYIENLSSLESLDVSGNTITDNILKKISTLKKIKQLRLENTSLTSVLAISLPHLTHLDLSNNKITTTILEELSKFSQLNQLRLNNSITPDTSLKTLLDIKRIRYLTANNTIFNIENLETIFSMAKFLNLLELKGCRLDTLSDTKVGDKYSVRRIYANAPAIADSKLRYINLDDSELNFEDVDFIK